MRMPFGTFAAIASVIVGVAALMTASSGISEAMLGNWWDAMLEFSHAMMAGCLSAIFWTWRDAEK